MTDDRQTKPTERSPRAPATRFELYMAVFIIWLFHSFAFGELLRVQSSWARLLYWAVSLVMVGAYGLIVVGMWWVGRRERDGT